MSRRSFAYALCALTAAHSWNLNTYSAELAIAAGGAALMVSALTYHYTKTPHRLIHKLPGSPHTIHATGVDLLIKHQTDPHVPDQLIEETRDSNLPNFRVDHRNGILTITKPTTTSNVRYTLFAKQPENIQTIECNGNTSLAIGKGTEIGNSENPTTIQYNSNGRLTSYGKISGSAITIEGTGMSTATISNLKGDTINIASLGHSTCAIKQCTAKQQISVQSSGHSKSGIERASARIVTIAVSGHSTYTTQQSCDAEQHVILSTSGSSTSTIHNITTNKVTVTASGSSIIRADGIADELQHRKSGSARLVLNISSPPADYPPAYNPERGRTEMP